MDEAVAEKRGIRGFSENSRPGKSLLSKPLFGQVQNGEFIETNDSEATKFFKRRVKVSSQDRQLADLSVSHDGEYAVAVCLALNEMVDDAHQKQVIVDDGTGDPIHEPEWADDGWFDLTEDDKEDVDEVEEASGDE